MTEFHRGRHDAIASDDKRFIRKLRVVGVPFITPGSLVFLLVRDLHMTHAEADGCLEALSPLISDDELTVVRLKLAAFMPGGPRP